MSRKKKKPEPKSKILILGTTPTRMAGPIDDPEWEVWTIGPGGKDHHRWDMLFEVHHIWPEEFKDYINDLSLVKAPQKVVTLDPAPVLIERWLDTHGTTAEKRQELKDHIKGDWASNVVFPRQQMFDRYYRRMWFSSSISYCIAMAIERQPTDIGLFGIDLESGEEYISQFEGAAHFIDVARMRGINVHMPGGCGLERDINPYPDRYETHLATTFEKKHNWLSMAVAQLEPQLEAQKAEFYRQEGANLCMRTMGAPEADIAKGEQHLAEVNAALASTQANIHQLKGELNATQFYRRMYVWGFTDPEA